MELDGDVASQLFIPTYVHIATVYYDDIFVGCIGCRVEVEGPSKKLYIMVLGVLAPYRGRGIGACMCVYSSLALFPYYALADTVYHPHFARPGSELLRHVVEAASAQSDIKEVYLHVWTSNDDAVRFYTRNGFEVSQTLPGYYRGISPPDCYVLRKVLQPT